MWNDVITILKRAADCQKLAAPEDTLSEIVRETSAETELDEGTLDRVAAAVHFQRSPTGWKEQEK